MINHYETSCTATVCGNYDRQFDNNCRALTGAVPDDFYDCEAFCSFAEASAVDRKMLGACKHRVLYEKYRLEIMSRNNPRRRQSFYPPWEVGAGNPLGEGASDEP